MTAPEHLPGFFIATRQKADILFGPLPGPIEAADTVVFPVKLISGYARLNFLGASRQPFSVLIEEACDPDGQFVQTGTFSSSPDTQGIEGICELVFPCGSYMRVSVTNLGATAALDFCGSGLPHGAAGSSSGGGATGPQGVTGPAGGVTNDIFAATRVVDPAGAGTDLTIASAIAFIAASPNPGGDIYIKPGVYVEAAPFNLPADKDVIIRGAGVDATTIQFNFIGSMFVISGAKSYVFRDLTILSDGTPGRIGIEIPTGIGGPTASIIVSNVSMQVLDIDLSDQDGSGRWLIQDSSFSSETTASIVSGSSGGGSFKMSDTSISASTDAILGFGGMMPILVMSGCLINGNLEASAGTISGCELSGTVTLDNTAGGDGVHIIGGVLSGNVVAKSSGHSLVNVHITAAGGTPAIDMTAIFCVVADCRFSLSGGSSAVVESGGAGNNVYDDNIGVDADSVFSSSSILNGAARANATGATANAYATLFTHLNAIGLIGIGTIVNTDATNGLTVRETVTDVFGTTVSKETPVVAGAGGDYLLDLQGNFVNGGSTAFPPFVSYQVEVKSTVPGLPATYALHHVSQGAI